MKHTCTICGNEWTDNNDALLLICSSCEIKPKYPAHNPFISSGGLIPSPFEERECSTCKINGALLLAQAAQITSLKKQLDDEKANIDRYYKLFKDAVKLAGERWERLLAAEDTVRRIRETCKVRFKMLRATIDSLNKLQEQMVTLEWHHRRVDQLRGRQTPEDYAKAIAYWKEQYEAEATQCREADELVGWIRALCDPGARAEDPAARNAYAAWELYRAKYPKEPT